MQSSAIYDPRTAETPSQADAAKERAARLRRIGARARADTPIMLRRPQPLPAVELEAEAEAIEVVDQELLLAAWVGRQREKHADELKKFEEKLLEGRRPPIDMIQKIVSAHYGYDWRIMFTGARTANVVRPRQVAMFLSKTMAQRSLPEIGRRFGGRDHTTVLHAVRKIGALIQSDKVLAAEVFQLKSTIEAKIA